MGIRHMIKLKKIVISHPQELISKYTLKIILNRGIKNENT